MSPCPHDCPRCMGVRMGRVTVHRGETQARESIDEAHLCDTCPRCLYSEIPPGAPPLGSEDAIAPDEESDPEDPESWSDPRD